MVTSNQRSKSIQYFVNGEEEFTREKKLTVGQILAMAGFEPIDEYILKSEKPKHDYDSHYDESVTIHAGQRFDALHKGPTPTS